MYLLKSGLLVSFVSIIDIGLLDWDNVAFGDFALWVLRVFDESPKDNSLAISGDVLVWGWNIGRTVGCYDSLFKRSLIIWIFGHME